MGQKGFFYYVRKLFRGSRLKKEWVFGGLAVKIVEAKQAEVKAVVYVTVLLLVVAATVYSLWRGAMTGVYALLGYGIIAISFFFIGWHVRFWREKVREEIDEYIKMAENSLSEGQYKSAISLFDEALKISPKSEKALAGKIRCYLFMKDREKAIHWSKEGVSLHPNSYLFHYLMGLSYMEGRLLEQAEDSLTEALRLDPKNVDVLFSMAELQTQLKRYETALSYYERCLQLVEDPNKKAEIENIISEVKKKHFR